MKKKLIFSLIVILLILKIFILFFEDAKDSEKIHLFGRKNIEFIFFPVDQEMEATQTEKIENLAKSQHLTIAKYKENSTENNTEYYVLSEDLANLMKDKVIKNSDKGLLLSTKKEDFAQYYYPDFLNNDTITYYNWTDIPRVKLSPGELYLIAYDDIENRNYFFQQLSLELRRPIEDFIVNESPIKKTDTQLILLFSLCLFLFCIIHFYHLKKQSSQIGTMKLLGFSLYRMTYRLVTPIVCVIFIFIIGSSILELILIKNKTLSCFLFSVGLNLLFCIGMILLEFCFVGIIAKQDTGSLLKGKSISRFDLYGSYMLKGVTILLLLLLFQYNVNQYEELKKIDKDLESLSGQKEFLFIGGFYENPLPIMNTQFEEQVTNWFGGISEEDRNIFYADFQISIMSKDGRNGFAVVDTNYLKREKIAIKSKQNVEIEDSVLQEDYLLFPKGLSQEKQQEFIENFGEFAGYSIEQAKKHVYYYDQKSLRTYNLNLPPSLQSYFSIQDHQPEKCIPIPLLVIQNFPTKAMINYKSGALKIDYDHRVGKMNFYQQNLLPSLKEYQLSQTLKESSFKSFSELLEDIKIVNPNKMKNLTKIIFISIIVYCLLMILNVQWLIQLNQKDMIVKVFLGFSKTKILKTVILTNTFMITSAVTINLVVGMFIYGSVSFFEAGTYFLGTSLLDSFFVIILSTRFLGTKLTHYIRGRGE